MTLAQAALWVTFLVCHINMDVHPWRLERHSMGPIHLRADTITGFIDVRAKFGYHIKGIDCTLISTGNKRVFVVGTVEEVEAKLTAP